MNTVRLTAGQALVKFLDNQYLNVDGKEIKFVEGVAGIFGHGNVLGFGEALAHNDDHDLKFYRVNNEQGAGHIAMGFAKQHRRKKIMVATSSVGPGAMNMITAAATATSNRIPVLFVPGDIFASRQPDPVLQQIEQEYDYTISSNDAFKSVSKYWDRITRPEQLMTACINAMRVLTDPAATGAVTLAFPQDVQAEAYDYPEEFLGKRVHYVQRRALAEGVADRLADIIKAKKKPLLLLGGGVRYSEAADEFVALAEQFNIPFAVTQAGKSTVVCNHPLNMGGLGTTGTLPANRLAKQTDCLIAVGTRLNDFHTASKWAFQNPDLAIVGLNVNAMDAYKMNAAPALCDAKVGLKQLHSILASQNYQAEYDHSTLSELKALWQKEVKSLSEKRSDETGKMAQTHILSLLNNGGIADNSVVVCAAGSLPADLERMWETKATDTYHMEYAYSCMGYEIAGAIGAKIAHPEREVYAFVGDGSYLMYHQELVMAVQEGIKINVILIDNGGWQCIDNLQTGQGVRRFGCELRFRDKNTDDLDGNYVPIDFAMNAKSLGVVSFVATDESSLKSSIELVKESNTATLLEIKSPAKSMTGGYESFWHAPTPEISTSKAVEQAGKAMRESVSKAKQY